MKKYSEKQKKLHNEIALLQLRRVQQKSDIKHEVFETVGLLKPSKIITNTVVELYNEPIVKNSIIKNSVQFVTGYLSKKIIIGKSNSLVKSMLSYFSETIISNVIINEVKA